MSKSRDLLHGSLWDKILLFALPVAGTGMLQQLFNAADIAVVGQLASKNAMAAVGSNTPVVGLLVGFFTGIALGANVVIAHHTGSGNHEEVGKAVDTALALALIFGVGIGILGEVIAVPFLTLLGVPAEIFDMAVLYLRVYLIGMPVTLLFNFLAAIYRSQGDARTPLITLAVSGVLNVGFNIFFVVVVGWDVAGVALGTVIANTFSSIVLFIQLHRTSLSIRRTRHMPRIDSSSAKRILSIGLPAAVQGALFSIANLVIQSAINSLGPDAIAGSSAAQNIEFFIWYFVNAYSQAATTFISQNYGAGNLPRCRKVGRQCLLQDTVVSVTLGVLAVIFARPLVMIFNGDPYVVQNAVARIYICAAFQVLNMPHDVLSGILRGYGHSLEPAIIILFGVVGTRIFWVFQIFPMRQTLAFLLTCFPVSWIVADTAMFILYFILMRKIHGGKDKKNPVISAA